jgi:hypothetical protein
MFQILNAIKFIRSNSDIEYLDFYKLKANILYLMTEIPSNDNDNSDVLMFVILSLTSTNVPILTQIAVVNNKDSQSISYTVYDKFEHMRSICEGEYFSEVKIDILQTTSTKHLTDYEKATKFQTAEFKKCDDFNPFEGK